MNLTKNNYPRIYLINTSNHNQFKHLISFADDYIKLRTRRIKDQQNIANSLVGNVARKLLLYKLFKIKDQEIIFNEQNKPELKNYKNLHFNISHSKSFVVIAINTTEIGIDIQQKLTPNEKIINYIFTEKEKEKFYKSADKSEMYTKLWTQKESAAKLTGKGMAFHKDNDNENIKTKTFRYKDYIISYSVFKNC